MNRSAIISEDKKYRYELSRIWSNLPKITFIMLNPSFGNEHIDDKTIKRLIFFSKKFGYGGFYIGNIFPNINTKVKDLYLDLSHDKEKNRKHVFSMIKKSICVVYAWGKTINQPPNWIDKVVDKPLCFGYNVNGTPKHPLYLKKNTTLISFR